VRFLILWATWPLRRLVYRAAFAIVRRLIGG
jgi:hypothetical protein